MISPSPAYRQESAYYPSREGVQVDSRHRLNQLPNGAFDAVRSQFLIDQSFGFTRKNAAYPALIARFSLGSDSGTSRLDKKKSVVGNVKSIVCPRTPLKYPHVLQHPERKDLKPTGLGRRWCLRDFGQMIALNPNLGAELASSRHRRVSVRKPQPAFGFKNIAAFRESAT